MRVRLPPPSNWQDFESLCLEVWRSIWSDPNAQKNGRQGQAQCGVDVFGRLSSEGFVSWVGVQCKLRGELRDARLTETDIVAEVDRAESFRPPLGSFTLATTASRDAHIQAFARSLSAERMQGDRFAVQVFAWEDIEDLIFARRALLENLYGHLSSSPCAVRIISRDVFEGTLVGGNAISEALAFFESPEIRTSIGEVLRVELRNVVTELALNAFQHGRAKRCSIRVDGSRIVFSDNGGSFSPLLPPSETARGVGLRYVQHFLAKQGSDLTATYECTDGWNIIEFSFSAPMTHEVLQKECTILLSEAALRRGERLQSYAVIPRHCKEYNVDVPYGLFNPSSITSFIMDLLGAIDDDARVVLRFSPIDLMRKLLIHDISFGWYDPSRVVVTE